MFRNHEYIFFQLNVREAPSYVVFTRKLLFKKELFILLI